MIAYRHPRVPFTSPHKLAISITRAMFAKFTIGSIVLLHHLLKLYEHWDQCELLL